MPYPYTDPGSLTTELNTFVQGKFAEFQSEFIGERVLPTIELSKQSVQYGVIPTAELLKPVIDLARQSGSGYITDTARFDRATIATQDYGLVEVVDNRDAAIYADFMMAYEFATARALHRLLTAREARCAAEVMDFAVYTGNASLNQAVTNGQWSAANSTPIADIELAVRKVYANTGLWPNAIVMNRMTYRTLRNHADIISRITSSGAGDQARAADVDNSQFAALFDLRYVIVGGGTKSSGTIDTPVPAQIWPNHVMVCRVAEDGDMSSACIGRSFHWGGEGSSPMGVVEVEEVKNIRSTNITVRHEVTEARLFDAMGCMIPSVIA